MEQGDKDLEDLFELVARNLGYEPNKYYSAKYQMFHTHGRGSGQQSIIT